MHDAVMAEFGDSHADAPVGTEASREGIMPADPDIPEKTTEDDIALVELQPQPQTAQIKLEA
jgi:hypothetical protein